MPYRVSRDAGHKVIHLHLFVKTLPLDRFISLFVRLFFHGIHNFEDVFKILRVWEAIPSLLYIK